MTEVGRVRVILVGLWNRDDFRVLPFDKEI
jgi:hypothetical protein